MCKNECSGFIYNAIKKKEVIVSITTEAPIEELKAVKNPRER